MLKNAQKRWSSKLKATRSITKLGLRQKQAKKFSVNLNIARIQKHKEITDEALRESILGDNNPMKDSIYSEEYFRILDKERSEYAMPVTVFDTKKASRISHDLVSEKCFYETTSFFEQVQGLGGKSITSLTTHPLFVHPEELRFDDDEGDYEVEAQEEEDPIERAYNLRQIDYIRGETEGLFDFVYSPEDHFEKYIGELEASEESLIEKLGENQILIANIPAGITAMSVKRRLENISVKPVSIREKRNNFGDVVQILFTFNKENFKGVLNYLRSMVFKKNTLLVLTNQTPVEQESLENRTIVVENIPLDQDIHRYIETMTKVPGFLNAEAAFEYKNPVLSSTDEVKKSVEENMPYLTEEEGYEAFILEKDGDRVNQIALDNDFDVSNKVVVKGNEFDRESIVLDRYEFNLKEGTEGNFMSQFSPIQGTASDPEILNRKYEITEKVFFESAKHSQEQFEDASELDMKKIRFSQDPDSPYYNRLGDVTDGTKKRKMFNRHQLAAEGEKHLGYFFATFGTSYEAKKAIYIATQKFDFLNEDLDRLTEIKANLKNE